MRRENKIKFIAEVSSNHNSDIKRCFKFIEVASKIGCWAVKFQLFRIDKLFAPAIVKKNKDIQKRKKWELPLEFIPRLAEHCRKHQIKFSCTPFYIEAVKELKPYVDFYKIASYELLRMDLIKACAETGKPVVISTGMATIDEVKKAVEAVKKTGNKNYSLLHCVSSYPSPAGESNLSAIESLAKKFGCPAGWSDHSVREEIIYRAAYKWGAKIIEFHLDLEGKGKEFGFGHCWLPPQMEKVIKGINDGFPADGDGIKKPVKSEKKEREWRADPSDGFRPLIKTRKRI